MFHKVKPDRSMRQLSPTADDDRLIEICRRAPWVHVLGRGRYGLRFARKRLARTRYSLAFSVIETEPVRVLKSGIACLTCIMYPLSPIDVPLPAIRTSRRWRHCQRRIRDVDSRRGCVWGRERVGVPDKDRSCQSAYAPVILHRVVDRVDIAFSSSSGTVKPPDFVELPVGSCVYLGILNRVYVVEYMVQNFAVKNPDRAIVDVEVALSHPVNLAVHFFCRVRPGNAPVRANIRKAECVGWPVKRHDVQSGISEDQVFFGRFYSALNLVSGVQPFISRRVVRR